MADSSTDFNPFFDESADAITTQQEKNPFEDDSDGFFVEEEVNGTVPKPTVLQVDEDDEKNGLSTYTSLDEEQQQHVTTIMRSVSMEEIDNKSPDQDLYVRVDSPEKHVEGYVSYSVTTQVSRSEFESTEYKVRRRYQDFLWLRKRLEESNPTHIIPPLPEKFTFSKHMTDKYDPDFLKTRQKALDKFMKRIVDHPVLSFSENLKTFLTAKAWEMTTARKKQTGTATRVGGSVRNTAAQLMMKNRPEEFSDMLKYNTQFQGKMKQFGNIADNIAQERFYLLEDNQEYGSAFRLWANSESKLSDTLNAVAESLDFNIENLKAILRVHELRICEPIREYSLYCDSVKVNRQQINWKHLVDLYEWDLGVTKAAPGLRKMHRLTEDHISLSPRLRMRVNLAAQVMSKTVADTFAHRGFEFTKGTEEFVRLTDNFFDSLNVTSTYQGKKNNKEFLYPYESTDDWRLKWLIDVYLKYINSWKAEANNTPNLTKKMRNKLCLSSQTIEGIRITIRSFVELVPYLLNMEGARFFLSDKINQDPLEEHFGLVRMRGGGLENPTQELFGLMNRKIVVAKSDLLQVLRGNTRGRMREERVIDTTDERSLPKRSKKK